jgi:REP element-mobilizing transposase RayT
MAPPLAYFLTWTTYGTWLPGDARGWVDKQQSGPEVPYQAPDPQRERAAKARMKESPVILTPRAREVVEAALRETCSYRGWTVHALSVRTNHVHIVVTAPDLTPGWVMRTLKAYATRALNRLEGAAETAPACQRGLVEATPTPALQRGLVEATPTPACQRGLVEATPTPALQRGLVEATPAPACQRGLVEASCDRGAPSPKRQRWWTEDGSKRYINDERSLAAAVHYVNHQ